MKAIAIASLLALGLAGAAVADEKHHAKPATGASTRAGDMAEGEVRRVDKDAKKITIKHGPLAKLDMPPMTMVFQVADPAMVEQVKPGDKIRFEAEKIGGGYRVTKIEQAR
jgi:Cu(I)/Ag(I) efflux system periplasmic protein CusF